MHLNKPIKVISYEGISMVTVDENGKCIKSERERKKIDIFLFWFRFFFFH